MKNKINYKTGSVIFLAGISFDLIVQFVFSIVTVAVAAATGVADVTELSWYSTINLVAMFFLQAAFVAALIFGLKKQNCELFVKPTVPTLKQALFGLLTVTVCLTCFSWAGEWFYVLLDAVGFNFSGIEINGTVDLVLAIIVTAVIAPVVEETLFRNALLGGLLGEKKPTTAIIMCGAAFALMHMSAQQTVYQFMLGCSCAYIVYKTGSIVVSIAVHAVNNIVALVLSFANMSVLTPAEGQISVLLKNPLLAAIITVLLFVGGIFLILFVGNRLFERNASPYVPDSVKNDRSGRTVFVTAMCVCGVMWIFNFIGSVL